jgi:hypothetical protein
MLCHAFNVSLLLPTNTEREFHQLPEVCAEVINMALGLVWAHVEHISLTVSSAFPLGVE